MIPTKPSDADDAATKPITDLPLFSPEEISDAHFKPAAPETAGQLAAVADTVLVADQATLPIEQEPERAGAVPATPVGPQVAPLAGRIQAAALDAVVLAAVLISLLAGGTLLGAPADLQALPFYLPTWLLFGFLYFVIPLLFWGRTPGMAYAGVIARGSNGAPLSVGQAIRRWMASMATMGLIGLPGLVALSGRSLADRLSHTSTFAD